MNDYIIARKGVKVYMEDVITSEVDSITTQHTQTLCLGKNEADRIRGRKVLIVDDVISTGASLESLENLVKKPVHRCPQSGSNLLRVIPWTETT